MNICIVGGIFGKSPAYREIVTTTPETTLANGLMARGHSIQTASHTATVEYASFDVVHVHHLGLGAINAALDRSSTPLVFTGHSEPRSWLRRLAHSFVVRRADAVVDLTETLGHGGREWPRRSPMIRVVIPNGVSPENFDYSERTRPAKGTSFRFLYVGQLIPLKRVDVLLAALKDISRTRRVTLELAYHHADPREEEKLGRLVRELELGGLVTFRGAASQPVLGGLYRAAHAVVLPSETEYLPGVLTEAMMCGTPVVASAVGAIPEQVGAFGVLVQPGSVADLVRGLYAMMDGYEQYSLQSLEMAATARRRYSVDAVIEQHLALYRELLERGQTRRQRIARAWDIPARTVAFAWMRRSRVSTRSNRPNQGGPV